MGYHITIWEICKNFSRFFRQNIRQTSQPIQPIILAKLHASFSP